MLGFSTGVVGCRSQHGRNSPRLEAQDPGERIAAIIRAAEQGDRGSLPGLVDRLEDEDPAVRFYAILALDRMTGTRMGYRHGAPVEERRVAVDRWRRFLVDSTASDAVGTSGHAPVTP